MKKLIKLLMFAALALLLLVAVGVFILLRNVDNLAKSGIEKGATYALGVNTTLDSIHIGLMGGTAELKGLNVANPAGFTAERFMLLKQGEAAVTLGSLREDTVELPFIRLNGVEVNIEKKGDSGNYDVILDNLEKVKGPAEEPASDQEGGKGFIIREITIRDITANVRANMMLTKDVSINIPEIKLRDIGSGTDNGAQMDQVTKIVMQAIMTAIAKKGLGILPADLLNDLESQLGDLGGLKDMGFEVTGNVTKIIGGAAESVGEIGKTIVDPNKSIDEKATEITNQVGKTIGGTGEKAVDSADKILKGVGGLLGGKKKEEEKKEE